jgi:protein-disulfide isomerase
MSRTPKPHIRRPAADVVASVAMTIASAFLVVMAVQNLRNQSIQARPSDPPLPKGPIPISTTALKGSQAAPVVLLVYSDFECPFCRRFATEVLPAIEREYVDSGKVALAFKHLPLERIHANAVGAAVAAECAGEQGKFWPMHDRLFSDITRLGEAQYRTYASELRLDSKEFGACIQGEMTEKVRKDAADSGSLGLRSTPTVYIGRFRGGKTHVVKRIAGFADVAALREIIDDVLLNSVSSQR